MSTNVLMDKEYIFSSFKERDPVICNNVDELGRNYGKWNKPDTKRKRYAWFHLYVESKKKLNT